MARWEDAFDAQIDIFRFLESELGRRMILGFAASVNQENLVEEERHVYLGSFSEDGGPPTSYGARDSSVMNEDLPDNLAVSTFNADPVWVDPEMMTIWEGSVEGFKAEGLLETDLITPNGCLLLPRPFLVLDRHNKMVAFRVVQWSRLPMRFRGPDGRELDHEGIMIALWSNVSDDDDYWDAKSRAEARKAGVTWCLLSMLPIAFTTPRVKVAYGDQSDPRSMIRPLQALFRLMSQHIAVRTQERPGGQFGRRWERAKLPEKRVTVVRLRRPHVRGDEDHEPTLVEWTHRWLVGGHWRNQYYSSAGVHRQIWISPYVKGPEELPLEVNKLRVFELVR